MHRAIFILLIGGLFVLGETGQVHAQAVLMGRLVDRDTGQPLRGAHIFLSGTSIGTHTDGYGRYVLRDIPIGKYRLNISMIGYGRTIYGLEVGSEDRRNIDLSLKPVVYEMDELDVGNLDEKWRKNLEHFEELFIGTSEQADSVVILNPEVLRFDTNFWGRMTAEALAPLQIVNRSLGYQVTYYLDEFKHTGLATFWHGEPLFREMTPSDSLQQSRWEENRRKAFYGSMRHFWLSVLDDRVEEEGFDFYMVRDGLFPGQVSDRFRISAEDLIKPDEKPYLNRVQFSGYLEIIYDRETEGRRYLEWASDLDKAPGGPQVSWLELNERSITVDEAGEVVEPYGAIQLGYFGFHRLADLTPREYRPVGFFAGREP